MKLSRPIRYVIFDLDGVLLDTEPLYTEATQQLVGPHGKTFTWKVKAKMMGRDALVSARILVDELNLPFSAEEYLANRKGILHELYATCEALEGAPEWVMLLEQLEVPMAIATTSTREVFGVKTGHHDWIQRIGTVVCGDDPELTRPKPAPDIFLLAARRLAAAPQDCLVFEDSVAGVEAAKAAGMQCVALVDPNLGFDQFEDASFIIRGYDEIRLQDIGL